jgi:hypothetical protein
MTVKHDKGRDHALDDLLRKAFAADLPADVATGMRDRIDRFRARRMEERGLAAGIWPIRRTVWAALSILMLIAGILLQGTKASSPLADRIASLKAAGSNIEQIRR